jgi:glycogen debranching enzyme
VNSKYQEKYAFAWWVLLNNIVSPQGFLTRNTVMPSKAYYIGAWLWDNALHAIALRYLDSKLAQDQIKLMYDHQLSDGMLPDAIYDEGIVAEIDHPFKARVTKPPIMAWAIGKLYERYPNKNFIEEIYPHLVRENAWWFSQNDLNDNGLVEYAHPYSSGLDDSPLWDGEMPVESPDINTYLYLQMENLAWMADILGKSEEATVWRSRSDALLNRMISIMWDEEKGLFWATHNDQPVKVITPFNLFPLWTGKLSENMVENIITNLVSPDLFWKNHPIPTVALNDNKFDPNLMWRGPIWANINYFMIEALLRNNKNELARQLRDKTLDLIANSPGIYEYYNPITGIPPLTAAPVFSWTAAVFIELSIQATFDTMKEK